jgi:hypothetical protein
MDVECLNALSALAGLNEVTLVWALVHCGILGNKEAGKFARQASAMPLPGAEPALGTPKCSAREAIVTWSVNQNHNAWSYPPGHKHSKLFVGRPCKKRADGLLNLSRHQLEMVVAILTGHAAVRKHLRTTGLFEGGPTCRFCRKETKTVQLIICGCEAMARQRYISFGYPFFEPKDISTASVRNLCLFVRGTGLLYLC